MNPMNGHPLLAGLTLLALAACGTSTPAGTPSPSATARYLVGADPGDDPCSRIVSAIGYADALLAPPGAEDTQRFGEGVRGRLAYVHGVVLEYGPRLPRDLLAHEVVLRTTTERLSPAGTPADQQVRELRRYRRAAAAVERGCRGG